MVTLFSATAGLLIFRMVLNRNDAHAIMEHMFEQKKQGALDFAWLGANPEWIANVVWALELTVSIGGFFGCLLFFFYQRNSSE